VRGGIRGARCLQTHMPPPPSASPPAPAPQTPAPAAGTPARSWGTAHSTQHTPGSRQADQAAQYKGRCSIGNVSGGHHRSMQATPRAVILLTAEVGTSRLHWSTPSWALVHGVMLLTLSFLSLGRCAAQASAEPRTRGAGGTPSPCGARQRGSMSTWSCQATRTVQQYNRMSYGHHSLLSARSPR